jgi:hypothetical protein
VGYQIQVASPDNPDIALGVSIAFDRPGVFDSLRDSDNQALNNFGFRINLASSDSSAVCTLV